MKRLLLSIVLLTTVGCGPVLFPAVKRLPPDEQAQVNQAWDNLLTPPHRADRLLLLDAIICYQLHERGADRVHLVTEKQTVQGLAILTVDFDRLKTGSGSFTFTLTDPDGHLIRHEHYTGDEVFERVGALTSPAISEEQARRIAAGELESPVEVRMRQITAATQPSN